VWIATGHTDMRRGMNSLALQVQEALKRDPHLSVGGDYVADASQSPPGPPTAGLKKKGENEVPIEIFKGSTPLASSANGRQQRGISMRKASR
jgi:transposase